MLVYKTPWWLAKYRNKCPAAGIDTDTVTHFSTNRVRRRLTSLIETNALPLSQTVTELKRAQKLIEAYVISIEASVAKVSEVKLKQKNTSKIIILSRKKVIESV